MKRFHTRRQALQETAVGFGGLALSSMMAWGANNTREKQLYNLAVKQPHFAPKAKNVIFIYVAVDPAPLICTIPSRCCESTMANPLHLKSKGAR